MSKIVLNVPQGLGDIFWIYQKVAHYFDEIEFNICTRFDSNEVEARSLDWMRIFPKCIKTNILKIKEGYYNLLLKTEFTLNNLVKRHRPNQNLPLYYSCNKSLEKGIRLENIDKNTVTLWNLPLPMQVIPLEWKHYIVLYISGTNNRWTTDDWLNLVKSIYQKYDTTYPIYVLGANFDSVTSNEMSTKLTENNINNKLFIGRPPEEVCFLLKNAEIFIGHQSGLNIIADNLDVKQLMIYHDFLAGLTLSWPKLSNINNKTYNFSFFNISKEDIVSLLPKDFLPSLKHKILF